MAWVQADLDALDAAIAKNVKSVTFADGRKTEYQNADQMLAVRKVMAAQLSMAEAAQSGLVRRRFGAYRSGV